MINSGETEVLVVRTGTANIGSILVGLKRAGAVPRVVTEPSEIPNATHVVVPGVGTFGASIELLRSSGCEGAIKKRVEDGKPTFFICVGIQMMGDTSDESPGSTGLRIFSGHVTRFPLNLTVPQQGWNMVIPSSNCKILTQGYAYYSNSYKFDKSPENGWNSAISYYGGSFIAAIEKGPVLACQFHPELSGNWGLQLIKRWIGTATIESISIIPSFQPPENMTLKTRRIIPCLDVANGKVVKGIKFQDIKEAGIPSERAEIYEIQGADELVVLDISATIEARKTRLETVKLIRSVLSIPLTVGGGVGSVEDVQKLLESGADKVAVNTAAVKNPNIINEMAMKFGRQCTVLSLDASQLSENKWEVVISAGKQRTGIDAVEWAVECEGRGAGEILLTSWDRDGTKSGYDVGLISAISKRVHIPIIASGGAATPEHMADGIHHGADAVLAASIFHYGEYTVHQLKEELSKFNVSLRM